MLAGVSHDLRTPLTRMRLQTALMPQGEETDALEQDISELEKMIDGYLAFARGEGEEKSALVSLDQMLGQMISQYDKLHQAAWSGSPGRGSPEAGGAGTGDAPRAG